MMWTLWLEIEEIDHAADLDPEAVAREEEAEDDDDI